MPGVLNLAAFGRVERATGGFDTNVWRLDRGPHRYALRVFRADQQRVLDRELLALGAARAAGLPVPRVHAVGSYLVPLLGGVPELPGDGEPRPAVLLDWCPGTTLLAAAQARPAQILRLGHAFGRLQRQLHQVAAPPGLRTTWIDWGGPIEPRLRARLEATTVATERRLLHLDWHPLNVLVEHGQLTAILDWTNAHGGDPRADTARTATILRLSPPRGGLLTRGARGLLELGWRAGYGPFGQQMAQFYAWAGLAMQHDLTNRVAPSELAHVRHWTATWLRRAGLSDG
jgi:aminoglycoside phosphotransferase (APT) family kinase protein